VGSSLHIQGHRILFVGGKGGVGKTTTAATLALMGAEAGRRVLLVSTDPAHSLGDLFGKSIGDRESEILPNLTVLEIDSEQEVDRYLAGVAQSMRGFVRPAMYGEIERQIELTRHSPGASEAALMEQMARLMESAEDRYDQVIFDTAPTGHTLRLLMLPEIMTAWMDGLLRSRDRSDAFSRAVERLGGQTVPAKGGHIGEEGEEGEEPEDAGVVGDELSLLQQTEEAPLDPRAARIRELLLERRRRFSQARRLLLDTSVTAFVMVLIPEKLSVLETEKAVKVLKEHRVPIAGLVVNRVLPEAPLGEFLESRRTQEGEYLDWIDRSFRAYPRVRVPLMRRDVQGVEALREVARYLTPGD